MEIDKPHIIKFSGGRSSGMMLMELLKNNKLNPERGDVIIFNNTSAEHSATYDFTRSMKKLAEEKYNIPFFGSSIRHTKIQVALADGLENLLIN